MELIWTNRKGAEKASIVVPDVYDLGSELKELLLGNEELSDGLFRLFHTDGLILIDVHSHLSQRATANLSFKDNVLLIVFHLEGDVRIMDMGSSHDYGLKLQRGEHKFEIFNANNLKIIYEPALMLYSFIVVFSPEFRYRIIPHNYNYQNYLINVLMEG